MQNLVLYDWVSITSKIHTPEQIISLLGMDQYPWDVVEKNAHGYTRRLSFLSIKIHFDGSKDQGVWLEMSGQGCRAFESLGHGDYDFLFSLVLSNPDQMKITRLDIAFDDHSGLLDLPTVRNDVLSCNYLSKARYWECCQSSVGESVYIGSPQSPIRIRIYDKAAERKVTDGSHWVRVEMQLRDDRCFEFVKLQKSVGETFAGVLLNYLRFVVPDFSDSNKSRWPTTDYWDALVGGAQAISIYSKPGIEYNLLRTENFVYNHAGNSAEALIQVYGVETFLEKLLNRPVRRNPKLQEMVNNCLKEASLNEG